SSASGATSPAAGSSRSEGTSPASRRRSPTAGLVVSNPSSTTGSEAGSSNPSPRLVVSISSGVTSGSTTSRSPAGAATGAAAGGAGGPGGRTGPAARPGAGGRGLPAGSSRSRNTRLDVLCLPDLVSASGGSG